VLLRFRRKNKPFPPNELLVSTDKQVYRKASEVMIPYRLILTRLAAVYTTREGSIQRRKYAENAENVEKAKYIAKNATTSLPTSRLLHATGFDRKYPRNMQAVAVSGIPYWLKASWGKRKGPIVPHPSPTMMPGRCPNISATVLNPTK
jgi:hypothetical protein